MPPRPKPPEPAASVRSFVKERAGHRCEYCQLTLVLLHVDHIVPWSLWADTPDQYNHPDNLACACLHCNSIKQEHVVGFDALTDAYYPLYNPRSAGWSDHFAWSDDYLEVVPVSATGRATMSVLQMNRRPYRQLRKVLRDAWHGGGDLWP